MDFLENNNRSAGNGNGEDSYCQKMTQCWRRYLIMDVSPVTLHIRNKDHRDKFHLAELEQVRRRWNYASLFFFLLAIGMLVKVA